MHIPKTAGSTLNTLFQKQYKSEELLIHLPEQKLIEKLQTNHEGVKGIGGHYNFGLHEYIKTPAVYFSMVRHPVDRIISLYHFLSTSPDYILYDQLKETSFEQFIDENQQVDNHQTYFFSGGKKNDLDVAIKNIEKYFPVVGVTNRFNESIYLMKKEFGWKDLSYYKVNVTKKRPALKEIPEELIQKIKEKNEFDMKLYEYVNKRLSKQIKLLTKEEQSEIQKMN
jgi:Sulfotransferase family